MSHITCCYIFQKRKSFRGMSADSADSTRIPQGMGGECKVLKSSQSSPRLGWLMDMACDRKAGKGVSGVRAAEVIGECGYALVSVSLTTNGSGCRLAEPRQDWPTS